MEVVKSSQMEKCHLCFLKFPRKSLLLKHLKEHADIKKEIEAPLEEVSTDSDSLDHSQKYSQVSKCRFCGDKFLRKSFLNDHIKEKHKKNKQRQKSSRNTCPFCDEMPSDMKSHIKEEHSFSCKLCRMRFKTKPLLVEHIYLEHPTCEVCNRSFNTKKELLVHQKDHPEEHYNAETTDDTDSDASEEDPRDVEDRDFHDNINCVNIERFAKIKDLITKNDFKTLSRDKKLLKSLSIIMNGLVRGFIPICSAQRLVLANRQKELMNRLAKKPSGRLVMKERKDLSLIFDTIWKSVKHVSESFLELNE